MNYFNSESSAVKSALFLFAAGFYTDIDQVPNLFNLREVVKEELEKLQ